MTGIMISDYDTSKENWTMPIFKWLDHFIFQKYFGCPNAGPPDSPFWPTGITKKSWFFYCLT